MPVYILQKDIGESTYFYDFYTKDWNLRFDQCVAPFCIREDVALQIAALERAKMVLYVILP